MQNLNVQKVNYADLNARQKESYNFQKVSAVLADYGFTTIKLSDDWQGADFLALHMNGKQQLKIQLKGRFTVDKKYMNKDIHIAFPFDDSWYLYLHDDVLKLMLKENPETFAQSQSWKQYQSYSWPGLSKVNAELLKKYRI